jgi:hypothetical protein
MQSLDEVKTELARCAVAGPIVGNLYRHYTGALYVVTGLSVLEATLTVVVRYVAEADLNGVEWVRPLADFTSTIGRPHPSGAVVQIARFMLAE